MRLSVVGSAADVYYIVCGEFRLRIPLTNMATRTPLAGHITHIVSACSDEQVPRIDARRIIAVVTDEHPGRYWPVSNCPGCPMGRNHPTIRALKSSIAPRPAASRPHPARPKFWANNGTVLVYPFPQSIGQGARQPPGAGRYGRERIAVAHLKAMTTTEPAVSPWSRAFVKRTTDLLHCNTPLHPEAWR